MGRRTALPDACTALTFRDQCLAIVCPKYRSLARVVMAEFRRKANVCRPALEDLPESMLVNSLRPFALMIYMET